MHCLSLCARQKFSRKFVTVLSESEPSHCVCTHTHTRLTALCPGLPRWAGTRKEKPIWILLKQETVSGNGIRWAICKSAPCSRQITTPAPHHSIFYRLDALPAAHPTVSKHARHLNTKLHSRLRWQREYLVEQKYLQGCHQYSPARHSPATLDCTPYASITILLQTSHRPCNASWISITSDIVPWDTAIASDL